MIILNTKIICVSCVSYTVTTRWRHQKVMSIKITTLLKKIDLLSNKDNASVLVDFYDYMRQKGSSENHIMNKFEGYNRICELLG